MGEFALTNKLSIRGEVADHHGIELMAGHCWAVGLTVLMRLSLQGVAFSHEGE
jgi:hypothetical protein